MFESTLWDTCNYIGTKVSRFLEGPEVPLGVFPHIRPDAAATTTAAAAGASGANSNFWLRLF